MGEITYDIKDKIATVVIDNPPVNALNKAIIDKLETTFDKLKEIDEVYTVILTGAGKAFVAGADISQFSSLNSQTGKALVQRGIQVFQKIADFPFPVICAVNGIALGGGLELALACDIRVASENAKFGVPEIGLGIIPGYGGTQRLPRLLALGYAKLMVYSGDPITADEAYRIGLVEKLVPVGEAYNEAVVLAKVLTTRGPLALKTAKNVINTGIEVTLKSALNIESDGISILFGSEDKNEGAKAFFEKRQPKFSGK